jgi:hypothetical protein
MYEKVWISMNVTLRDFLLLGKLGNLQETLTPAEVQTLLGLPTDISVNKRIWKYGALQIAFYQYQLTFLGFYFRDPNEQVCRLNVIGYFPTHHTTFREFQAYLDRV